jgi:hypothetical protein
MVANRCRRRTVSTQNETVTSGLDLAMRPPDAGDLTPEILLDGLPHRVRQRRVLGSAEPKPSLHLDQSVGICVGEDSNVV